jgi:hypothetical protein
MARRFSLPFMANSHATRVGGVVADEHPYLPHAMRNLSSACTTPPEGGAALAELALSRFTPTTSYGGWGLMLLAWRSWAGRRRAGVASKPVVGCAWAGARPVVGWPGVGGAHAAKAGTAAKCGSWSAEPPGPTGSCFPRHRDRTRGAPAHPRARRGPAHRRFSRAPSAIDMARPQSSDASAPRCDDPGLPQSDVNDGHASPHSGMTMHFSVVLQLPDLPRSARSRGESYRRESYPQFPDGSSRSWVTTSLRPGHVENPVSAPPQPRIDQITIGGWLT